MTYDLFEHRHRLASWAAARAAQRGVKGGTVAKLADALNNCGVKVFAQEHAPNLSNDEYKTYHQAWCKCICTHTGVTYGRAAKLVAMYLKTMIICGPDGQTQTASIIYPPIDRILLSNLASSKKDPT